MVRSLWTAASGMKAQQTNVDTISNNLANISTVGYKKQTTEFKSLLYQTIQDKTTSGDGNEKPVGAQVGLGVRNSAIVSRFDEGSLMHTENDLDLAITGEGFYTVEMPDKTIGYTRSCSFSVSLLKNGKYTIATSEGYPLLDTKGKAIEIDKKIPVTSLVIDESGNISVSGTGKNAKKLNYRIGIVQFKNPAGLEKTSDSILVETDASGEPVQESKDKNLKQSAIRQGYLEQSNVQVAEEMVNLIIAQRAYEMNSKIITASDEMLQQANALRN